MGTSTQNEEIERLEKAFWQSILDGQPNIAAELLTEPALTISTHGVIKFDRAAYIKMASSDRVKLVDYSFSDMEVLFPTDQVAIITYRVAQTVAIDGETNEMDVYDSSTWIKASGRWLCVMHTEIPAASAHGSS
ncbi:nuclear transport factor 2 family protein [Lysobacter yananisis]|uniref:Nuclear transport factor 2 family protein n=1 Tax=Lysobacter yananisis TaxID=1003114 RepID=A0ABY9PH94_9GAMM|nr:nuclear transport factor 2 family protein [Lysobacter yananisis]WMT05724.1 nuclear transport factor 2 family protein [Lysobacter yananisis]